MHSIFKILGISTLLINLAFAITNNQDTLRVYPFRPVVVTGTRIQTPESELPSAISVVPERIISEQNHVPLLDLISENVPNLFVTQRTNIGYGVSSGSAGNISIRGVGGFPNTQVLVLIDGRPDIMGLFGHPLGDAYFLHDVERIEVLRGPASLIYGSNAMGGAINIITDHQYDDGFKAEVPIRIGNDNTRQGFIHQTFGGQHWGYSISGGCRNSDGFREKGNDSYNSRSANGEFHYQITDQVNILFNSYLSNLKLYDPGLITSPFAHHWFDLERRGGDVTIRHKSGALTGDLKLHHNFGFHEIRDGDTVATETPTYKSRDFTTGLILSENYRYSPSGYITAGLDYRIYGGVASLLKDKEQMSWNNQEHQVEEFSLFSHLHHRLFKWINLDAGLRYTQHSVSGKEVIPAGGLSLEIPSDWIVKLQYAKGYRNPTLKDLYLFLPSNTDLKPEISNNIEATLEKQYHGIFNSALTIFYTELSNLIEKSFIPTVGPIFQNKGQATIRGVELEGQLLLPPHLAINWSASASDFSQCIGGSPGEKVDLSLRYTPFKKFFVTLQGQWINNLYSDDNPYDYSVTYVRLDPYILLNLRINGRLNKYLKYYTSVENITDKSYQTMHGFPMPGRTFTFGLTAQYK